MATSFELNQIKLKKDHGEITLYQRKDHSDPCWQTRIKIRHHTGYVKRSTKTRNLDEGKQFATSLYESLVRKFDQTGSIKTKSFNAVVDEWLDLLPKQSKSPKTIQGFRDRLYKYPVDHWKDRAIDELQHADLIDFIEWRKTQGRNNLPPANTTIRRDIVPLRQVFKYAFSKKYISYKLEFDPIKNNSQRRAAFSENEWDKIVTKLPEWAVMVKNHTRHYRDRIYLMHFILLIGYSGIRPGSESSSLTWESINHSNPDASDDNAFSIRISKGKTGPRTAYPNIKCEAHLLELKEFRQKELKSQNKSFSENELIFCHENGEPIHSFKKGVRAFLENYNLLKDRDGATRSSYSFRHTFASFIVNNGGNHWHLATILGTSVEMLEKHYVHNNAALAGKHIQEHANFQKPTSDSSPLRRLSDQQIKNDQQMKYALSVLADWFTDSESRPNNMSNSEVDLYVYCILSEKFNRKFQAKPYLSKSFLVAAKPVLEKTNQYLSSIKLTPRKLKPFLREFYSERNTALDSDVTKRWKSFGDFLNT